MGSCTWQCRQEHGDILETLDVYFADRFAAQRIDGVLLEGMEVICSDIQWHQLDQHKHYNIIYIYVCVTYDVFFFKKYWSIYAYMYICIYARHTHTYIYIFNVYLVSQLYRYIYISYKLALVLQFLAISRSIQLTKHISIYAGFLKWRYPQTIHDHVGIETDGDLGMPHVKKPPCTCIHIYICVFICLYLHTIMHIHMCVYTYVYMRGVYIMILRVILD